MKIKNSKQGFTLMEIIITVGLLFIVSGLLVGIVFSVQNTLNNTNTIAYRQYHATMAQKIINNYIKTGENILFSESGEDSRQLPQSSRETRVVIDASVPGEECICIQKSVLQPDGSFAFDTVYRFENGQTSSNGTVLDKIEFTLQTYSLDNNEKFKLYYKIWCGDYSIDSGMTILNMKEVTTQQQSVTLDLNDSGTWGGMITIIEAENPLQ